MTVVFIVALVVAIATFLTAFAYDYVNDWSSKSAHKVGVIAWVIVMVSTVGAIATADSSDDDGGNKVTIECVISSDESLTCEVVG